MHSHSRAVQACCAAMQLCLVGSKHFNTFGSHGAYLHVNMRHFDKLEQCCQYLKEEQGA